MKNGFSFSQVPVADIPRSVFNRSHGHKTTFDAGLLIPFFVDEALPGDTFQVNASLFARLATPIFPIMDNMYLDVFWFAVPNRLLWDNWPQFMGEQQQPGDSTDFLVPEVDAGATGFDVGSIFDYMGVPTGVPNIKISALFPRAYHLIYNEWFRDENLCSRLSELFDDGPDPKTDYTVARRGKRHDYFTSCLPWPQKGPAAELPIGGYADVIGTGTKVPHFNFGGIPTDVTLRVANASQAVTTSGSNVTGATRDLVWEDTALVADLSTSTAVTINALREAFQVQRLMERDARGGTRYIEILRSHFGVVSPDARVQRPEYLGGGTIPVTVNPVTQTSSTDTESPQGNLAAYGVAGGTGVGFSKSFVEHNILVGIVCARADLSYQQGLPRMFSRRTRYDFYWPALAHLGEQAVLNKEIYATGNPVTDAEVFGYQERWSEYRYYPSKITGKLRSTVAGGLDSWHLGQKFTAQPVLNKAFIEENPPIARVVAVPSEPHFLFDSHISMKCTRPMPTYSVPGMIDHF